MRIGYACLTVGVLDTDMRSCIMKNASETKLLDLIEINLQSLNHILDYNIANGIKLFRISSDLIPFGSSAVNSLRWWEIFDKKFQQLGCKIRDNGIRVSMHPGQYTVLNSPDDGIVERAVADLNYHARVLDSLGTGPESKMVLHIGGVYGDKVVAMKRFSENYKELPDKIKQRLVIENDDKSYQISDVLELGVNLKIPVVFDNLHNMANPSLHGASEFDWILKCNHTWDEMDGPQKIHYSQQEPNKKQGSHSTSIRISEFLDFYNKLPNTNLDIMLEVKDKNLSALKCINCISTDRKILSLEQEWSKYKYTILEKSPNDYNAIRKLLSSKKDYPAITFYQLMEHALQQTETIGYSVNAAMHVWGYFKNISSEQEKSKFLYYIEAYQQGKIGIHVIKNYLKKLMNKYGQVYLRNSYYFTM